MSKRKPIIVVTGFLGSGKTTFLKHLIKNSNKKFGLLINEFGDVGIDGDLIKTCSSCNDDSIIELNNGCICCTVQEDFIPAIKTLLNQNIELDGIVIETSGLALPIPLLSALSWPEIRSSVYLEMVIGLINGESMLNGLPINNLNEIRMQYQDTQIIDHEISFDELFEEQLQASDLVLVSRSDLIEDKYFHDIKTTVKTKLNPNVPVIKCLNGEINLEYILGSNYQTQFQQTNKKFHTHDHNHIELHSKSIKCNYFLEKSEFEKEILQIIENLKILRIKGRIWIPGKLLPLQVQIVGTKVNTWYEESPNDCWKPKQGGLEMISIGFEKDLLILLEKKIKEKFNVLSVSN